MKFTYIITLSLLLSNVVFSMEHQGLSVTEEGKLSGDSGKGEMVYNWKRTYQLKESSKPLVEIHEDLTFGKRVSVSVDRHKSNLVIVKALLSGENMWWVSDRVRDAQGKDQIFSPCYDDTIKDMDHYSEAKRYDIIRGKGTRLSLRIDREGQYTVLVPYDADVKVRLKKGDFKYLCEKFPTNLYAYAKTLNRTGRGSTTLWGTQFQSSEYWEFCRDERDPVTNLKTEQGKGVIVEVRYPLPKKIDWGKAVVKWYSCSQLHG